MVRLVVTELVKAGLFFVVLEGNGLRQTDNACCDAANCGNYEEHDKCYELLVVHYNGLNLLKRDDGVVSLHWDIEDTDNLHRTDTEQDDRVHLAVVLYSLRAEEGEEKEEKVVNYGKTDMHIVVVITDIGGIDACEIENVKENCNVTKGGGECVLCETHSVLFYKIYVASHFLRLLSFFNKLFLSFHKDNLEYEVGDAECSSKEYEAENCNTCIKPEG